MAEGEKEGKAELHRFLHALEQIDRLVGTPEKETKASSQQTPLPETSHIIKQGKDDGDIDRAIKQERLKQLCTDGDLRPKFARNVYWLLLGQVAFLGLLILLQGFGLWGFKLHDIVFGIFTSGNLLCAYGIVRHIAMYLFKSK